MRAVAATAAALGLLASTLPTALAFQGTFPLLAITSTPIPSLSTLLNPSHKSITPFAPDSAPQEQSTFNPSSTDDDDHLGPPLSSSSDPLCSLSQIILVNAPGLHHSDLAHLKDSLAAIEVSFGLVDADATSSPSESADRTVLLPYLKRPHSKHGKNNKKKNKLEGKGIEGVLKRYLTSCNAALAFPAIEGSEKDLWAGDASSTQEEKKNVLKIVGVEGLEEWELTGQRAREMRKSIMDGLDNDLLHYLPHPASDDTFLLIITDVPSLPSSFSSSSSSSSTFSRRSSTELRKRQYESSTDREIEQAIEDAFLPSISSASELEDEFEKEMKEWMGDVLEVGGGGGLQKGNGTGDSIFKVDKNSGLLHRYIFFTPPLILSLLISFLILIPVVTLTANFLTTTQTVHGLESKMTGSVGLDPSKA